jgi:hypothetical protein
LENHSVSFPLFNYRFKFIGFVLIILSLVFGYLYFLGGRPAIFEIPVFALVSSYMESRFLVCAKTNILDELSAICMIGGLLLITFSKEKKEEDFHNDLRIKSLIYAVYFTSVLWMGIFLLVYGWAIFMISAAIFLFFLLAYYLIFKYLVYKRKLKFKAGPGETIG